MAIGALELLVVLALVVASIVVVLTNKRSKAHEAARSGNMPHRAGQGGD